ncbi:MAG: lipoate--protein ligase family protein [Candidatus Omnitrophota bacterium]
MARRWRIIVDHPCCGFYNMAKDEVLSKFYEGANVPTLRIYRWQRPFVSLGYSQNAAAVIDIESCDNLGVGVVRRITGGFVFFHNDELTYSLICHKDDLNLPRGVKDSYKTLNQFLLNFYYRFNLKASFACDIVRTQDRPPGGNFCLSSYEPFDILIDGKKIGGNAQRRSREIIFQHGSIPRSFDCKMIAALIKKQDALCRNGFTSLDLITGERTDFSKLRDIFLECFSEKFNVSYSYGYLNNRESNHLTQLIKTKYLSSEWNLK